MRVHERQAADERLDAAVDWVRWNHPDLSVTALMPEGSPAVELLRTGADAGLIVVGNPGPPARSQSLLLGSVSHAVVGAATRPMAVVRAEVTAPADDTASDSGEVSEHPMAPAYAVGVRRQS